MIELLAGLPDDVVAFALHGTVSKADYDNVLIPDIKAKQLQHNRIRLYCECGPDYAGIDPDALWEDTEFGFDYLFDWDRAAMVTDADWMRQAVKFFGGVFGFLAPVGQWCVFPHADIDTAREWVVGTVREPDFIHLE
ncbi:STAS/SEC14 domain-containing protein [Mycolicibacterium pallens]|uniref:STAS/SEC14 domain-containing protein n=1 Tax=Mycolicibacterium pallens TaxID=370524 RepID=A0ABX8VNH3_9MYCO|nr:STAS/SEC14 domain-containing protein [Mycolicibacterium pallens]QYL19137.1 STAS/SEC14 domain-containing protein [Mycolicibacterium pallens]